MIIDGHIHTWGGERGEDILRALDGAGLDGAILISPYGSGDIARQREILAAFGRVVAADRSRLFGLAWVEPTIAGAEDELPRLGEDYSLAGLKLMPNHWYPSDDRLSGFYARVEELGLPILWHTGVLWSFLDGSRFCRPVFYEVMIRFPRIRFALAHIGWPWVDECLAVAGRLTVGARRETGGELPLFVDLSPGAPPEERPRAVRKAWEQLGPRRLLWASDDGEPLRLEKSAALLKEDRRFMVEELHMKESEIAAVLGGNHLRFLGGE